MTTLAELVQQDPAATDGVPIQAQYGVGTWRLVVQLADPAAGASVEWHDVTDFVSEMRWRRGADAPWGRYRATSPQLALWADGDALAPWNDDTSATFGTNVRLRAGLLIRAVVFRVANSATDWAIPLFTSRVKRWGDASVARGFGRVHVVDCTDLMSSLAYAPVGSQLEEGWRARFDDLVTASGWEFDADVYGAESVDGTPTITVPDRDATDSVISEIDATLDPVGLTWRSTARGPLVVHPVPWTEFHDDIFAGAGTIVGTEWANPLLDYYPGGVTFAWDPIDENREVGFWPIKDGASFGIASDIENIVNEWSVTYPSSSHEYDDPVSAGRYGRRPLQSASWIAENDDLVEETVDYRSYADLTSSPMSTGLDCDGAFPAIALLDHLDPCHIRHATRPDRAPVTADGVLRSISHIIKQRRNGRVSWMATPEFDLTESAQSGLLLPVENLAVSDKSDVDATFSWTNPTQAITPTETQVRLLDESTHWLDTAYPVTSFAWLGLQPDTVYRFQVRLVRRVDDIIVGASAVREVTFRTDAATVPVVPDGGDGTTIEIPVDDPACDIEWKLESSSNGTTWTTEDSGDDTDFTTNETTGKLELDLSAFEFASDKIYRLCTRQVCDEVAESWICSEVFQPACVTPGQLSSAPFDDASLKAFVPKICGPEIREAVTDVAGVKGPAFGAITVDSNGNPAVASDAAAAGIVAYGPADATIGLTGDASYAITVNLGNVPASGTTMAIWRCGGLHIEAGYVSSTTWRVRAKIFIASGGSITTTWSDALNLDTEYEIKVTHDVDAEEVKVYVDDTEEATGVAGTRINALAVWMISLPADSYATSAAVWSSVLDLSGAFTPDDVAGLESWWDASDASTITASGSDLTEWRDKANIRHLNTSYNSAPKTGTRTQNSLNVIDFTPNQDISRTGGDVIADLATTGGVTLFVVSASDVTGQHVMIGEANPSTDDSYADYYTGGIAGVGARSGLSGGNNVIVGSLDTSCRLAAITQAGSTVNVYLDGSDTPAASGSLSEPVGGGGVLSFGARVRASDIGFANGFIAEVLVYDGILSDTDRDAVEAYLMTKWGI